MRSNILKLCMIFTLLIGQIALAQEREISGTVTDESGVPLPGVNITVEGTTRGTQTDFDGNYAINASTEEVLVFSFVGFENKSIKIGNDSTVDVTMAESASALDEVVVIGYGSQRKKDVTGAISSLDSEKLTQVKTVSNVAQALQGQATGVRVNQASGQPGEGMKISIRGLNSLGASNEPLYVVDGMPLDNLSSQLNPDDIQNITILKDASSTAIYGSRGANGVIMITTKQGQQGKLKVNYSSYLGFQKLRKKVNLLDAKGFANLQNEVAENDNEPLPWSEQELAHLSKGTDWQDLVYRTAAVQSHDVNISGGNENTKYFSSFGYYDQDGIIRNSGFKRYSYRVNLEHNFFDKLLFKTNFSLQNSSYRRAQYQSADGGGGIPWATMVMPPTMNIFDDEGNYTKFTGVSWGETNPVGLSDNWKNRAKNTRLIGNINLKYSITDFLSIKTSMGLDMSYDKQDSYFPGNISLGQGTDKSGKPIYGVASKSYSSGTTFVNENIIEFNRTWSDLHQLEAVAGLTYQFTKGDNLNSGSAEGFLSDIYENNNIGSAITKALPSSSYQDNKLISYLARANYIYDNRYFLTLTGRYDGSSRFGANKKFAFFPSVAVAWNLTEENFLKNQSLFSLMKIRSSYGLTGNQAIANYQTLANISDRNVIFDNSMHTGFVLSSLENANLKWETTKQFDVGLELGFLENNLQFTFDFYNKNTKDLLLNVTLPGSGGFSSVLQNVGEIQNRGLELTISASPKIGKDFAWNTSLNVSSNATKVLDLGKDAYGNPITYKEIGTGGNWFPTIVGESMMQLYGYTVEGIYKSDQEAVDNGEPSKKAGDYKFKNWDGEGVVNDEDDRTVISHLEPKFVFGFNNQFNYKNFDLSMLIVGSYGNDIVNEFRKYNVTLNGKWVPTKEAYAGRFDPHNDQNARFDKPSEKSGGTIRDFANSLWVEDGSYLRLRDITIGYSLPERILSQIGIERLRIYASAQNYLTLTKYSGYDPEVSWGSASINGWDRGNYPSSKSITAGIQLQF